MAVRVEQLLVVGLPRLETGQSSAGENCKPLSQELIQLLGRVRCGVVEVSGLVVEHVGDLIEKLLNLGVLEKQSGVADLVLH